MTSFCLTELRDATQGVLSQKDADALANRIKEVAKQRVRDRQEEAAEAQQRAVEDIIAEQKEETEHQKRVKLLNLMAIKKIAPNVLRFTKPWKGMIAELDGVQGSRDSIRKGAGRLQQANRIKLMEELYSNLREGTVFEDFNSLKDKERELAVEMHAPGTSDDPTIQKMSTAVKKTFENTRKLLNRAGANIKELSDYITRQTHDPTKLAHTASKYVERKKLDAQLFRQFKGNPRLIREEKLKIAFERWKNSIKPKLDIARSFQGVALEKIDEKLKQVYENIVSGEHQVFTEDEGTALSFKRSFSATKKLGGKRSLHFKDGGSWYDYQQEYGSGSLHDQILKQLWDSGGQLGLMEKFGPSARGVYETVKEEAILKNKNIKNIRKKFRHADWTMDELEGKTRGVPDNILGKLVMGFRMIRSMNLGSIWLSSLGDFGLAGAKAKSFGGNYLSGEFNAIKGFMKGKKDLEELSQRFGIASNASIGAALSRFSSVDSPFSAFAKLNSWVTKFNMMGHHDDSLRFGWAATAGKTLGLLADKPFEDIPIGVKQTLTVHGLGEKEWDLMRHPTNRITSVGSQYLVAPDLVKSFSHESIAKYLGKKTSELTSNDLFNVKEDMKRDWYNYFADEADDVIPNPSPSSMAWIHQGTRGDEFKGMLLRLLGQFKPWNIEVTRRTLGRYLYGGGADDMYDALINGKADLWGLAEFILQQGKWGYISASAVNIARGLEPPDPLDPKTLLDSIERGGGGGVYMSVMDQFFNKYTGGAGGLFIPPSVGTMKDTTDLMKAVLTGNHPLFAATKFAQRNFTPLQMFYSQTAFNHLILYSLMEKSKPGYIAHLEAQAKKDGKKYWLTPSGKLNL